MNRHFLLPTRGASPEKSFLLLWSTDCHLQILGKKQLDWCWSDSLFSFDAWVAFEKDQQSEDLVLA